MEGNRPWQSGNEHKTNDQQECTISPRHSSALPRPISFHDSSSPILDAALIQLRPNDTVPSFSVNTLNGIWTYRSGFNSNPVIIFATSSDCASCEASWQNPQYIDDLLIRSPNNTEYLFMSYDQTAAQDANTMQQLFSIRLQALNIDASLWKRRAHFVTDPVGKSGTWIAPLLASPEWQRTISQLQINTEPPFITKRLDARYDWLYPGPTSVFGNASVPVAFMGNGCNGGAILQNVSGSLALIEDGGCDYFEKASNAASKGAKGILVFAINDSMIDMNCVGNECNTQLSIPGSMIPRDAGLHLLKLVMQSGPGQITVTFTSANSSGFWACIDGQSRLQEFGWALYPSMAFLAWAAEWYNYKSQLLSHFSHQPGGVVVPVWTNEIMTGKGIWKNVHVGTPSHIQSFDTIELEASLDCPGGYDALCPIWDRIVDLKVCCSGNEHCGSELGRWITPFRRRVGHWVTDISGLAPLLFSQNEYCNLSMTTDWWLPKPWMPSLNIRMYNKKVYPVAPVELMPLFEGGTFDKNYNSKYKPINFTIPMGTTNVSLVAVITGHGSDNNGCGEFCITSHHFVINGIPNVINFTAAGSALGCADATPTGVVPNEHGTWLYGRDGWCDGRQVNPWVVDVTSQINLQGENTIVYYGWFQGGNPNPVSNPGVIFMTSQLVFYEPTN
eukprot:TRINITY_DN5727_c0_g1_i1.p1 TRINITY_DN5727_c0_g1~~TRINITY_DN5727_c0_g1_i1.p1  ORF type:complete len:672 (+),score=139.25 TRINITY_DN5727_c0_g1_i1:1533-3548(+)